MKIFIVFIVKPPVKCQHKTPLSLKPLGLVLNTEHAIIYSNILQQRDLNTETKTTESTFMYCVHNITIYSVFCPDIITTSLFNEACDGIEEAHHRCV